MAFNWHHGSGELKEIPRQKQSSCLAPDQTPNINATKPVAGLANYPGENPSADSYNSPGTLNKDSCDVLVFRDGKQIGAKVLLYADAKVRFYPCGVKDGPVSVVNSSELSMIKYTNGDRIVFEKETSQNRKPGSSDSRFDRQGRPKQNHAAEVALGLGLTGFLTSWMWGIGIILLLVSLALAIGAVNGEKKSPGTYAYPKLAVSVILMDILFLILAFVIFYAFLQLVFSL